MIQYTVKYAKVKHARIRLAQDLSFVLTIPIRKSKDKHLEELLLQKAEKMLEKRKTREKNSLHESGEDYVMIFWEKLDKKILWEDENNFLQEKLREISLPLLEKYSQKLALPYQKLHIKTFKSKWWSCNHKSTISLNLKLVHLPIIFLEYVIVHEVCHLKEKNHGKHFWALVEDFLPNYKETRKELKNIIL